MEIIDAAVGGTMENITNIDNGLAYVAVQVGNNWQLPSGKTAYAGNLIVVNGVFGHATATITGGSTNIVENTNWVAETDGVLNSIMGSIATYRSSTSYTKLSDITSMLQTLVSSMSMNETKNVVITTGTDTSLSPFTAWGNFSGYVTKINEAGTYWVAYFVGIDGRDVEVGCNNGTITARSINDNTIKKVSEFTIAGGGSTSFTLPSDGVYLVAGYGSAVVLQNVVFLIGGYATASRCSVVNLSGTQAVTIDASNTSSLTFVASNSQPNNSITLNIIKLR